MPKNSKDIYFAKHVRRDILPKYNDQYHERNHERCFSKIARKIFCQNIPQNILQNIPADILPEYPAKYFARISRNIFWKQMPQYPTKYLAKIGITPCRFTSKSSAGDGFTRTIRAPWHLRGRRGTWRHPPSFHVAGVALLALGWHPPWFRVAWQAWQAWQTWQAWQAWQAWHLATSGVWWRAWSPLVACDAAALCVVYYIPKPVESPVRGDKVCHVWHLMWGYVRHLGLGLRFIRVAAGPAWATPQRCHAASKNLNATCRRFKAGWWSEDENPSLVVVDWGLIRYHAL